MARSLYDERTTGFLATGCLFRSQSIHIEWQFGLATGTRGLGWLGLWVLLLIYDFMLVHII